MRPKVLDHPVDVGNDLKIETVLDDETFRSLRIAWEDLLKRAGRHEVYLSHRWIVSWLKHFGSGKELRILIIKDRGSWIGAVPLVLTTERWHGLKVRTLHFPINLESGNLRSDFILTERKEEAVSSVIHYLQRKAGEWERWDLSGLPVGSSTFIFLRPALERSTLRTTMWRHLSRLYYLPLAGSWVDYLKGKSFRFRKGLRNAENRLRQSGKVAHLVFNAPNELAEGLEGFFALEARSSKVDRPGVIRIEGNIRRFYQSLAESFGETGDCRIDLINLDGKPISALFSLSSQGNFFLLNTCYDPESSYVSPGKAIIRRVLENAWSLGQREVDFNGLTTFVQTWTDQCRNIIKCTAYGPTLRSRLVRFWEEIGSPAIRRATSGVHGIPLMPLPRREIRFPLGHPMLPPPLRNRSCVFYENGQTALDFGMDRLPLKEGDEILFPSYHCGTERKVLTERGFQLRYYRVPRHLRVDTDLLFSVLTDKTKAIYLIHYLGWPQEIRGISKFCQEKKLLLIEDCAQALYGNNPSRPIGSSGDLAIFSLHKFLPLQDGGVALFNRSLGTLPCDGGRRGWKECLELSLQTAMRHSRYKPGWGPALGEIILHATLSLIGRVGAAPPQRWGMSEVSRRFFPKIDHEAAALARRSNYQVLLDFFENIPGLAPLFPSLGEGVVPLCFPLIVDNPPPFLWKMKQAGIEADILWSSVHPDLPLDDFPEVAFLKSHLVVLPVHQDLAPADLSRIQEAVDRFIHLQQSTHDAPPHRKAGTQMTESGEGK